MDGLGFLTLLVFYCFIQLLGVMGFIFGCRFFEKLEDVGYSVSKILGIFIFSVCVWFVTVDKVGIFPYTSLTIAGVLLILLIAAWRLWRHAPLFYITKFKELKSYIYMVEIIFAVSLLIFTLIRSFTPEIEGTEKPHEFALMNSILRDTAVPPEDAWFADHTINYYYFGHFIYCNVIKLLSLNSAVVFNIITPLTLALIIVASCGVIFNLTKSIKWGIFAGCVTGLVGNIEPIVQFAWYGTKNWIYRWWDTAHVIPNAFQEFPFWSFLHGDVHAHFLVHPFTLLILSVLWVSYQNDWFIIDKKDLLVQEKLSVGFSISLLVGSQAMINSWNFPPALFLLVVVIFCAVMKKNPEQPILLLFPKMIIPFIFYTSMSILFMLPFYLTYHSPVFGIQAVRPEHRTYIGQFITLFSPFLFIILVYLGVYYRKTLSSYKFIDKLFVLIVAVGFLFIVRIAWMNYVILISSVLLILSMIMIMCKKDSNSNAEQFIFILLALCSGLVLGCEFFFIDDPFVNELDRQNTLSKCYIQVQLLMPLIASFLMYKISQEALLKGLVRRFYIFIAATLFLGSSLFLILGTWQKSSFLYLGYRPYVPTLNGTLYINHKYEGDYEVIEWMKKHIKGRPTIIETLDVVYSYYGRVASQTGLPTLINWEANMAVLHGDRIWNISVPRREAIHSIYSTIDKDQVLPLLRKYGVRYVFVGFLENKMYDRQALRAFMHHKNFKLMCHHENTYLYEVIDSW